MVTTRFWNNFHQVRWKSSNTKVCGTKK